MLLQEANKFFFKHALESNSWRLVVKRKVDNLLDNFCVLVVSVNLKSLICQSLTT